MNRLPMGTWVKVGNCPIDYTLCAGEAELQLGPQHGGFELLATEAGLENLATTATAALRELREENRPHD